MTARFLTVVFIALLSLAPAAEKVADFEYGPRPPRSVFDPNSVLDARMTAEISDPLVKIHKDEGIDVIVVILADLEGAPPEYVAKRFAAAWCDSPIHAVVLHVPGRADGPWIVPAGRLIDCIKPEVLSRDVADAKRRASSEPTEPAKIRAAATETADKLRYWTGTAINRSEMLETARTKLSAERDAKAWQWKVATLTAAASAIPVLCGISALVFFLRKPGTRRFPNTHPPRRLGAPYAGGNHAVVDLGPPPPLTKP